MHLVQSIFPLVCCVFSQHSFRFTPNKCYVNRIDYIIDPHDIIEHIIAYACNVNDIGVENFYAECTLDISTEITSVGDATEIQNEHAVAACVQTINQITTQPLKLLSYHHTIVLLIPHLDNSLVRMTVTPCQHLIFLLINADFYMVQYLFDWPSNRGSNVLILILLRMSGKHLPPPRIL